MRHGNQPKHIHHMRQPVPQVAMALCEPVVFLLSPPAVQTPADTPVLVAVLM
jgi:hypothetical protein